MTIDPVASPSPTRRRRRWPRRLGIALLVVGVLLLLAPLALSLPLVKDLVADKVSKTLGRPVTIEGASAFWGKGIDLQGITVSSPEGFEEPLATVDHVHVDLDVLGLLGGDVDAVVAVTTPRLTLLEDATGRRNTEGLFPAEAEPAPDEEKTSLTLVLEVKDGTVRARPAPDAPYEEITDLSASVRLGADGAIFASLAGIARGAGTEGQDVELAAETALSADGEGPFSVRIPTIDLTRLASLVEQAAGLEGLTGTVELAASGEVHPDRALTLKLASRANGLAFRTASDLRVGVEQMLVAATVDRGTQGTAGEVTVKTEAVELFDAQGGERRSFREPLIEITLKGRLDDTSDVVLVDAGRITAGRSLTATVSQPWRVELGKAPRAQGQLDLQGDLGRLSALRALVPALAPLRGGLLAGRVIAQAADGLDLSAGLRVQGLELAPGDISRDGYREDDLVVRLKATRPGGEDAPFRIQVYEVRSTPVRLTTPAGQPFELVLDARGMRAHGGATTSIDLPAFSQALGTVLGLAPRERIGGVLEVRTEADLEDDAGTVTAILSGRGVRLPPSWAEGAAPTDVEGRAVARLTARTVEIDVSDLKAFGLAASGRASLYRAAEDAEAAGPETATLKIEGDLAAARGIFAPLLDLGPRDRIAGELGGEAHLERRGRDHQLHGSVVVTGLRWQDGAGDLLLDEKRVEIQHDVVLGADGNAIEIADLRVVGQTVQSTLKGSVRSLANGTDLDLTLGLQGDAGRLAAVLRRALGEGFESLKGSGPIRGSGRVSGSTAEGGRGLVVESSLEAGSWSVGGMAIADANLSVRRPTPSEPMDARLTAGVNTGRADVRLQVRLEPDAKPWTTKVELEQVDTSPLLVDQGVGKYLTYVLPTLLPTASAVPVLSGRLDAQVELGAADLEDPRREMTLNGKGEVRMAQGSLGESTLFRTVAGGKGLGEVGRILTTAVPEVGRTLASFTRSIAFSRLASRFTVANRVVTVQHGLLEGQQAKIAFQGTVGFNEVADLKMDLALEGSAGAQLARALPSRTIPLAVRGPLSAPTVVPNLAASDLAQGALRGLLPGSGDNQKNPLDRLRDLLPK